MNFEKIADRYLKAYADCTPQIAVNMFKNYPENFVYNDLMVIMFVRLNILKKVSIMANPRIIGDGEFIKRCYQDNGGHIYLLKAFGKAIGFRPLVRQLIEKYSPESLSFHRDDLSHLHRIYQRS